MIVKYDSEYANEVMDSIPLGYIDKSVCGCGITTVALENNENIIIAVPSVELIRNKVAQYPNDRFKGVILGVYGDIKEEDINKYLSESKPIKIMVTYDSLYKLEYLLDLDFKLIIDESNKLLSTSNLKSTNKRGFIDTITTVFNIAEKYKDTVSFVSATPTPLEYLPKWVSGINQVKIEWSNTSKAKPILMKRTYPYKSLLDEIVSPLSEFKCITIGGSTFSKAIIFINSLDAIIKIAKKANLSKKDVAIVAGNNIQNDIKIRGFNRLTNSSKLPKFTFITSSGFEGIDLEDSDAISIVVSNTSKSYQMIDVLTDLKQAISRQRNKSNPNYDKFIYMYNLSVFDKSKVELLEDLQNRYSKLESIIKLWETAKIVNNETGFIDAIQGNIEFDTYTNYYENTNDYVINDNLFNADKYFILNTREQYKNGFDIKGSYTSTEVEVIDKPIIIKSFTYIDLVNIYNKTKSLDSLENYRYRSEYYSLIEQSIKLYGKVWHNYTYTKSMVENFDNDYEKLKLDIYKAFPINTTHTTSAVKVQLQELYNIYNISKTAKSTDLSEFLNIKAISQKGKRYTKIESKHINKK